MILKKSVSNDFMRRFTQLMNEFSLNDEDLLDLILTLSTYLRKHITYETKNIKIKEKKI